MQHIILLLQIKKFLLFMQEFICVMVVIGFRKAFLAQIGSKGQPNHVYTNIYVSMYYRLYIVMELCYCVNIMAIRGIK